MGERRPFESESPAVARGSDAPGRLEKSRDLLRCEAARLGPEHDAKSCLVGELARMRRLRSDRTRVARKEHLPGREPPRRLARTSRIAETARDRQVDPCSDSDSAHAKALPGFYRAGRRHD